MKIRWEGVEGIYLYRDPVDGRKGIDGLAAIVQSEMGLPSMHCRLFLFSSKNRSRLKILAWDRTGFCLWLKRLEAEKFPWPKDTESTIELTEQMLYAFLDGFNIWQARPHNTLDYACFF